MKVNSFETPNHTLVTATSGCSSYLMLGVFGLYTNTYILPVSGVDLPI